MSAAFALASGAASILISTVAVIRSLRREMPWLMLASGNFLALAAALASRWWPGVPVDAACLLFSLWMWWRNRRDKGRFRALLSGKYAHVRDAMVRTLRDRRVPRPALAPGRA